MDQAFLNALEIFDEVKAGLMVLMVQVEPRLTPG
jgi:hypothetical protein